jgi:hypothetical protein
LAENPKVFTEYRVGGNCPSGAPLETEPIRAILDALPGSREVYAPQGMVVIYLEKKPEGGAA